MSPAVRSQACCEPISFALIGLGARAHKLYLPLLNAVAPWLRLAAVCTPDPAKAAAAGADLGVPAHTSVRSLVKAGGFEAAVVLSSVQTHHAISTYLSSNGIHHLVETPMSELLSQAEDMVAKATANGVRMLVAENYFRFPFDRLAAATIASGAIGAVGRVTCFQDQPGFHGTARWMHLFGCSLEAVRSIRHTMPTARHAESARRVHDDETWRMALLHFPGERLAVDMAGNTKGMLGRSPRPGLTEICGSHGAIVRESGLSRREETTVRICGEEALGSGGRADIVCPFVDEIDGGVWLGSRVDLPGGTVRVDNARHTPAITGPKFKPWDATAVMGIMTEFADHVRGEATPEFTMQDALAAMQAEAALVESAAQGSTLVRLPVAAERLETERARAAELARRIGADPNDGEALLDIHFPPAA